MKNFNQLISAIEQAYTSLQASAANAVNQALTIRNWPIGFYIVEFEQKGEDRATYGENVIENISKNIKIKGLASSELSRCRQFYQTYPYILGTLSQEFKKKLPESIFGTLPQKSNYLDKNLDEPFVPAEKLLTRLSFSHIVELIKIKEPLKRVFYELECIKGIWSVRELKRQINSLYFERSGLSTHPEKLAEFVYQKTNPQTPKDIIKNVYAFEFLEISTQSVIEESDLEIALLDHLQHFILELGNGFCLESRQKRLLIGENYFYVDLVFYHRILKCHILVELKLGAFEHGDIGQLNTYLQYFKEEVIEVDDNPPVGILLVAEKDQALIKYATAGMDENLFVQKYLIQLPDKIRLERYVENELKKMK